MEKGQMHPVEVKTGKTKRGEQEVIPGLSELISQSVERKKGEERKQEVEEVCRETDMFIGCYKY